MFGIEKDRLVEGLKFLQKRHCAYTGPRCDCKYGVAEHPYGSSGELNGCPELSETYKLIEAMSDFEFVRIARRAGIMIHGVTDVKQKRKRKKK